MKRLLALFFLINFFIACSSDSVPNGILEEDKMIEVLTDIHLADGYASVLYNDTTKTKAAALYFAVYKKYDTDSVQVRKSLEYYTKHPDRLQKMYEKINGNIQQLQAQVQAEDERRFRAQMQRMKDSVNLKDELKRDSMNKGFRIDTLPYWPFEKFVGRKNKSAGADSLLKPLPSLKKM